MKMFITILAIILLIIALSALANRGKDEPRQPTPVITYEDDDSGRKWGVERIPCINGRPIPPDYESYRAYRCQRPTATPTTYPLPTPGWIPPKPTLEPCPVAWGEPMPPGYNRPCIVTDPPAWLNEHLAR